MINRGNIEIFDYIFESQFNDSNQLTELITNKFDNISQGYIDFVKANEEFLVNPYLLITQTLDGYGIVSNEYPQLNKNGIIEYLNYKILQFNNLIKEKTNYDFNKIYKDLNITNSHALKYILDTLLDKNLIKCSDVRYFTKNILGEYEFDFEKLSLKINLNENEYKEVNGKISNTYNIQNNIINNNGNKNKTKMSKIEYSQNKKEIEKENILIQVLNWIKSIFKK